MPKNAKKYCCEICDFKTYKKSNYDIHILRPKHINVTLSDKFGDKKKATTYECDVCNKIYKSRNGLWVHYKKIHKNVEEKNSEDKIEEENNYQLIVNEDGTFDLKNIIMELLEQNKELQKQIMELSKNSIINNTNNTNINNSNNTFNLQVFLNEKCKDALNMKQFIESLKITMDDVERFGTDGFVEGITKIFLRNIKMLDVSKRPIHCCDLKRETLYIKEDDNTWQKDNENKEGIKKAIKQIAHKNFIKLQDWKKENPEYKDSESKVNDKYQLIMYESMGGKNDDEKNYGKIIHNISKEIVINKK